jgi:diguanylate cyclase
MPSWTADVVYSVLLTLIGVLAGCWLCRRSLRSSRRSAEQLLHAQQVLRDVDEVTARVATDVDAHTARVTEINDELTSTEAPTSETVTSTIGKLVAANQQMRERLATAEAKLQAQSQELEVHMAEARTDLLTRLANRRAFEDEISRRFAEFRRYGAPLSTILLDVDHFKQFNDTYGHRVGDEVLRGIAAVLRKTARPMDLVARYGGEEFAISLPGTSLGDACRATERYRQAIQQAVIRFEGKDFSVTASVGVAELLSHEQLPALMHRTDAALYAAKQAGRNVTYWHDGREIHPVVAPARPDIVPAGPDAAPARREDASAPPRVACAGEDVAPAGKNVAPAGAEGAPDRPAAPPAKSPLGSAAPAPMELSTATPSAAMAESDAPLGDDSGKLSTNECDRTVFCWEVRQQISQWKQGGAGFCVMLIRVDNHEQLVRLHGRAAADFALRSTRLFMAATLSEMELIGHYGRACFSLLLPKTSLQKALILAERLRNGATQCVLPTKSGPLEVSVSQGIAEFLEGDDTVRLLQRAEAALAAAQKGCTCYHNGQWPEPAAAWHEPAKPPVVAADRPSDPNDGAELTLQ